MRIRSIPALRQLDLPDCKVQKEILVYYYGFDQLSSFARKNSFFVKCNGNFFNLWDFYFLFKGIALHSTVFKLRVTGMNQMLVLVFEACKYFSMEDLLSRIRIFNINGTF